MKSIAILALNWFRARYAARFFCGKGHSRLIKLCRKGQKKIKKIKAAKNGFSSSIV
jgi:hypothetical protein